MSPFVVSAAFEFGYGCATLPKPPAGKFVQGIGWRRDQLDYLAHEIHSNAFAALQQTLNELAECAGDLDSLLNSEVDGLFEASYEPIYASGDPLEDVYDKWMERAAHFQIVAADGLKESQCWDWYHCGFLLGQYEIMAQGLGGPNLGRNTLECIRLIPEALLKYDEDPSLNSIRTCLTRLADFDFAKEGIEAWLRDTSREDFSKTDSHDILSVKDLRSLIGHIRHDIMVLIRNSPLENLLPDSPPGPPPAEANEDGGSPATEEEPARPAIQLDADGSAKEPLQEWRVGYLGLKIHEQGRLVERPDMQGAVACIASPLEWAIFCKLEKSRETKVSLDGLHSLWTIYGRKKDPELGTVIDKVSELDKHLKKIGVTAKNTRDLGYTLALIDEAQPAKPEPESKQAKEDGRSRFPAPTRGSKRSKKPKHR